MFLTVTSPLLNKSIKGYVNLWLENSCSESPPYHVWSSASGDVTSQDHLTEGSSNFMCGSSTW